MAGATTRDRGIDFHIRYVFASSPTLLIPTTQRGGKTSLWPLPKRVFTQGEVAGSYRCPFGTHTLTNHGRATGCRRQHPKRALKGRRDAENERPSRSPFCPSLDFSSARLRRLQAHPNSKEVDPQAPTEDVCRKDKSNPRLDHKHWVLCRRIQRRG